VSKVDQLIGFASSELGKPYVYGDEGPNTFDCSGLMQYVFGLVGLKLPRTAAQQQRFATKVSSPVPGDLVFYGNPAHHVALYIGNGKQIAAPHTGATVAIQSVNYGGNPTFGRVSGLGAVAGAVFAPVADVTGTVVSAAGSVLDWAGPARSIMLEVGGVLTGLALLGAGLWLAFGRRAMQQQLAPIREALS
jgi:hypothetical protein